MNKLLADYESFIEGKSEAPVLQSSVKIIKSSKGTILATLTKEIKDRDGEIVLVDGIEYPKGDMGIPLLDAHRMRESVVDNVLGKVYNIRKKSVDGVKMLVGEINFAPTPQGDIAKRLVEDGYVDSVSIGFLVKEYDPSTATITKSEVYELSLVSVPANPEARIQISKSLKNVDDLSKLEKTFKHYDEIRLKIKEYRNLFMSDDLFAKLSIEKSGDELIDMKNVYDAIINGINLQVNIVNSDPTEAENLLPQAENQQTKITKDDIEKAVNLFLFKYLQNLQ